MEVPAGQGSFGLDSPLDSGSVLGGTMSRLAPRYPKQNCSFQSIADPYLGVLVVGMKSGIELWKTKLEASVTVWDRIWDR
jgi:hypothetical protein